MAYKLTHALDMVEHEIHEQKRKLDRNIPTHLAIIRLLADAQIAICAAADIAEEKGL